MSTLFENISIMGNVGYDGYDFTFQLFRIEITIKLN